MLAIFAADHVARPKTASGARPNPLRLLHCNAETHHSECRLPVRPQRSHPGRQPLAARLQRPCCRPSAPIALTYAAAAGSRPTDIRHGGGGDGAAPAALPRPPACRGAGGGDAVLARHLLQAQLHAPQSTAAAAHPTVCGGTGGALSQAVLPPTAQLPPNTPPPADQLPPTYCCRASMAPCTAYPDAAWRLLSSYFPGWAAAPPRALCISPESSCEPAAAAEQLRAAGFDVTPLLLPLHAAPSEQPPERKQCCLRHWSGVPADAPAALAEGARGTAAVVAFCDILHLTDHRRALQARAEAARWLHASAGCASGRVPAVPASHCAHAGGTPPPAAPWPAGGRADADLTSPAVLELEEVFEEFLPGQRALACDSWQRAVHGLRMHHGQLMHATLGHALKRVAPPPPAPAYFRYENQHDAADWVSRLQIGAPRPACGRLLPAALQLPAPSSQLSWPAPPHLPSPPAGGLFRLIDYAAFPHSVRLPASALLDGLDQRAALHAALGSSRRRAFHARLLCLLHRHFGAEAPPPAGAGGAGAQVGAGAGGHA